jgi:hypothetical protein
MMKSFSPLTKKPVFPFRDFPSGNAAGKYLMGRARRARRGGWGLKAPKVFSVYISVCLK